MPSTKNFDNVKERLALFENARREYQERCCELQDAVTPPTDTNTYQQRERREAREIAEAWKRGK
jgi:hypothetical protein